MAQELLDATDGVSDALKRYKDRVESRIDDLDKNIKKSLGEEMRSYLSKDVLSVSKERGDARNRYCARSFCAIS